MLDKGVFFFFTSPNMLRLVAKSLELRAIMHSISTMHCTRITVSILNQDLIMTYEITLALISGLTLKQSKINRILMYLYVTITVTSIDS